MFVNYSDFYLNLRDVETEMFKINQNGYYKKFNPSLYDETYYKISGQLIIRNIFPPFYALVDDWDAGKNYQTTNEGEETRFKYNLKT